MRLNHHSIGDLNDIMENVANMSSPLIRANRHSEVLASDRNWQHHTILYNIYIRDVYIGIYTFGSWFHQFSDIPGSET